MSSKLSKVPRVINEFEGGPSQIYLGRLPFSDSEENRQLVFNIGRYSNGELRAILNEFKVTPTEGSISRMKVPLFVECDEECDDCKSSICPRPIEEVGEKGSGMQITEVLDGWFIDLGMCIPWKVCECCKGKGYIE